MIEIYADRWALITGASSGIGAEFARRLAALGMHLVMVARRKDRMRQLADELHTRFGAKCEIITADLSEASAPGEVMAEIDRRGIVVELLVNNAGFAVVGEVEATDHDSVLALTRLNIGALTDLTMHVLPGMLERGHGAIINVSSVAAFQPVAYMAAYAASKAYVLHFSEALWAEVRDRGVTIMALCPGVTQTEFFDRAGVPNWLKKRSSHSPEHVVRRAMRALEKRRQYYVVGWGNYIRSLLVRFFTRKVVVTESMKYFRPKRQSSPAPTAEPQPSDQQTAQT